MQMCQVPSSARCAYSGTRAQSVSDADGHRGPSWACRRVSAEKLPAAAWSGLMALRGAKLEGCLPTTRYRPLLRPARRYAMDSWRDQATSAGGGAGRLRQEGRQVQPEADSSAMTPSCRISLHTGPGWIRSTGLQLRPGHPGMGSSAHGFPRDEGGQNSSGELTRRPTWKWTGRSNIDAPKDRCEAQQALEAFAPTCARLDSST